MTETKWHRHAQLQDGKDYLQWPDLFEFVISSDGHRIAGRFFTDVSLELFQTYLLGNVLSFALLKLGIEPLHSTVVVMNGSAVAFLGNTGFGKSSLAAAFLHAGHSLLTDDLLVINENGSGLIAHPGPPRIKLFPEIANIFLGEEVTGIPLTSSSRKLVIPLQCGQAARAAVPLKAIYVLRPSKSRGQEKKVIIRKRPRRRAFIDLIAGTYNTVVRSPDRLARQFDQAIRLSEIIPIKSLSYPHDLSRLPEIVQIICADLP